MYLTELSGRLGVRVRLESFRDEDDYRVQGGLCRIGPDLVAFIDRRLPLDRRAAQLAAALAGLDLESVHMLPGLREYFEKMAASRKRED